MAARPSVRPGSNSEGSSFTTALATAPALINPKRTITVLPGLYLIHRPIGDYYSSWRAMHDLPRGGTDPGHRRVKVLPGVFGQPGDQQPQPGQRRLTWNRSTRTQPSASVTRTHTSCRAAISTGPQWLQNVHIRGKDKVDSSVTESIVQPRL